MVEYGRRDWGRVEAMEGQRGIDAILFGQTMDDDGTDGVGRLMTDERRHKSQRVKELIKLGFKGTDAALDEEENSEAVHAMSLRTDIASYIDRL